MRNFEKMLEIGTVTEESPKWFVMNAYKSERKAEEALMAVRDMEYFIPKRYVARKYQGRMKRVLVPVIPNLVFVRAVYDRLEAFKRTCPFLHYATRRIDGENRIMKVPDAQMDSFIRVASRHEDEVTYYAPDEIQLEKGTRVRVIGGTFDGVEGVLMKVKGKRSRRIVICVQDVVACAIAEVTPDLIQIL